MPLSEDVQDLYMMYQFCRTFNCSPREYEEYPFKQSQWLLEIDKVYHEAEHDAQERASRQQQAKIHRQ